MSYVFSVWAKHQIIEVGKININYWQFQKVSKDTNRTYIGLNPNENIDMGGLCSITKHFYVYCQCTKPVIEILKKTHIL